MIPALQTERIERTDEPRDRCRQEGREDNAVSAMNDALDKLRGKGGGLRYDVDSTTDENTGEVWLYVGLSNLTLCVDGDEAEVLGGLLVAMGQRLIEIGKGQ